jgi:hypothetical protein
MIVEVYYGNNNDADNTNTIIEHLAATIIQTRTKEMLIIWGSGSQIIAEVKYAIRQAQSEYERLVAQVKETGKPHHMPLDYALWDPDSRRALFSIKECSKPMYDYLTVMPWRWCDD